jgi:hypothetical protein
MTEKGYMPRSSYLEIQVHLTSGATPSRFVQSDPEVIGWLLEQVNPERLFLRRQLTLSGGGYMTAYPCSAIERIDFRSDSLPHWVQHSEIRDICEITAEEFEMMSLQGDYQRHPEVIHSQIELSSGHRIHLAVRLRDSGNDLLTPIDLSLFLSHLFTGPSLLARCEGGVFFLNPTNIVRFVSRPAPPELPTAAWPARYIRETVLD